MTNLPYKPAQSTATMLMDPTGFEQLYRVGRMLASSVLFPEHLRKGTPEQAAANGALVMNMAMRLNEDPLTVAQNIYFVGGKPGWSTSYLIAKANQHGVFEDPIDWEVNGEGDKLSVTAKAKLVKTGRVVSYKCDMAMAKAENWTKNPKYQSMPELMLRYRSAAALIRLYVPDVMVGVPAQIEVELDSVMKDVTPQDFRHAAPAEKPAEKTVAPDDAEIVQDSAPAADTADKKAEPKPETERQDAKKTAEPEPEQQKPADDGRFMGQFNAIMQDLQDAGSVDAVETFYQTTLEQIAREAPDLHKKLQDEFKAYREKEQG